MECTCVHIVTGAVEMHHSDEIKSYTSTAEDCNVPNCKIFLSTFESIWPDALPDATTDSYWSQKKLYLDCPGSSPTNIM